MPIYFAQRQSPFNCFLFPLLPTMSGLHIVTTFHAFAQWGQVCSLLLQCLCFWCFLQTELGKECMGIHISTEACTSLGACAYICVRVYRHRPYAQYKDRFIYPDFILSPPILIRLHGFLSCLPPFHSWVLSSSVRTWAYSVNAFSSAQSCSYI